ncbi:glycoside hydrolase [Crucibulum laeve]|uniref:alpha-amylase n=1 Tax=Crucibulum laeve TaxID=68775 RepID=A0A5C3LKT7_9AGAR|nr:glycoside hydrolase [Crucibulum laeve]
MKTFTVLASLLTLLPFTLAAPSSLVNTTLSSRAPSASKKVIIQMFDWNWDSIAAECTNFIGPAGYGYIQVSPPQEHIQGSQWWTDYQPVSYNIISKRGNRSQFSNMVNTCRNAGVLIIADTIWNHMAGIEGGTGVGGSSFTQYNYPGIYGSQDFHRCGKRAGNDIGNYNDREDVQTCELVNLADLATGSDYVRSRLAQYGNDLISLGVEGLRLDAAKHIPTSDINNILSRLSKKVYITQEVIYGGGEPIQPSEYVNNGDVQEYTTALKDAFLGNSVSGLQNLEGRGWVSGGQANVFVANHDTERNGASLTMNSPNNAYVLAHVFSLAHPYGTQTVLSSYQGFTNHDQGPPNNGYGTCSGTGGSGGWYCQHRFNAIAGMVGFRNNAGSTGITNWSSPRGDRVAFGRGNTGFVVINSAADSWSGTFATGLADGVYCNVITGKPNGSGSCTGASITISGGAFSATIGALDAIAIHTGALGTGTSTGGGGSVVTPPTSGSVAVTFEENATTTLGQNIFLLGSISELGSWAPGSAVALSSASYPVWKITVNIPAGVTFQYKFIRKESSGAVTWESDPNRQATTGTSSTQTLSSSWR